MCKYTDSPLPGCSGHSRMPRGIISQRKFILMKKISLKLHQKLKPSEFGLSDTAISLIICLLFACFCLACWDSRLDLKMHCRKVLEDSVVLRSQHQTESIKDNLQSRVLRLALSESNNLDQMWALFSLDVIKCYLI